MSNQSFGERNVHEKVDECVLCLQRYDRIKRLPMSICSRKHTICSLCLRDLTRTICPTCSQLIDKRKCILDSSILSRLEDSSKMNINLNQIDSNERGPNRQDYIYNRLLPENLVGNIFEVAVESRGERCKNQLIRFKTRVGQFSNNGFALAIQIFIIVIQVVLIFFNLVLGLSDWQGCDVSVGVVGAAKLHLALFGFLMLGILTLLLVAVLVVGCNICCQKCHRICFMLFVPSLFLAIRIAFLYLNGNLIADLFQTSSACVCRGMNMAVFLMAEQILSGLLVLAAVHYYCYRAVTISNENLDRFQR